MNPFFPDATLTPDIYWAHQPPAVRVLRGMNSPEVDIAAMDLQNQGYKIDVYIMVWKMDPGTAMGIRINSGYTWVPNGGQPNVPQTPQGGLFSLPMYDPTKAPMGSIKVSLDAADYPPFDPPTPVAPPATNIVGNHLYGIIYTFGPGAKDATGFIVADGQVVNQGGKSFTAHRSNGLMGETLYFSLEG